MLTTNGHSPERAILYARVSTDEQARTGYSLAQQLEALRDYAAREGYEVIEEVEDPGQSGAMLARPGLDRVRDLVMEGGVSVVLAQDRDRFAREPAYHYILRQEFEEHGTKIRALNDRGDDTPEGTSPMASSTSLQSSSGRSPPRGRAGVNSRRHVRVRW
jgi:site-specific DNA recombinase